jgi:hypothetical protein
MSARWWPMGSIFPQSVQDIRSMDYCSFERFAIEVLRQHYKEIGVEIVGGKCGRDGGRDGEASTLLGPDLPKELQVPIKIWLEAKHWRGSIKPNTAQGHLAAAFLQNVSKVIFVASGGFSQGVVAAAERYADKANLTCAFLTGHRLLELAECMKIGKKPGTKPRGRERAKAVGSRKSARSRMAPESGELSASGSFHRAHPQARDNPHGALIITGGEPITLLVTLSVGLIARTEKLSFDIAAPKGWTCIPNRSTKSATIGAGDEFRLFFSLFPPQHGLASITSFKLNVKAADGSVIDLPLSGDQVCEIAGSPMGEHPSPAQEELERDAREIWCAWSANPTVTGLLIQATQGHGKSFLLRRMRRIWLTGGSAELLLDCDTCSSPEDLLRTLFSRLFPTRENTLSISNIALVAAWFSRNGLDEKLAKSIAQSLCMSGVLPAFLGAAQRAEIIASLLTHLSGRAATVLVFNDLHKASASLIALIRDLLIVLPERGLALLVVMTSRFISDQPGSEAPSQWREEIDALQGAERVRRLTFSSADPAWATRTLATLFPEVVEAEWAPLIDQVGSDPFGLTEALRSMAGPQSEDIEPVIRYDLLLQRSVVVDPLHLRQRIASGELRAATARRLGNVLRLLPGWTLSFLQAGALLGRQFPLLATAGALNLAPEAAILALGLLFQECLLSQSAFDDADLLSFAHDLIRRTVIDLSATPSELSGFRATASALLASEATHPDPLQRARIAYASGGLNGFIAATELLASHNAMKGRSPEVVSVLSRAIESVDPTRLPLSLRKDQEYAALDEVFEVCPVPARSEAWSPRRMEAMLLRLLLALIEHATVITSGSAAVVEQAAGEALMIAEFLGDRQSCNRIVPRLSRMWIERGSPEKALIVLDAFKSSNQERLFYLPSKERAELHIVDAIALRLTGDLASSDKGLDAAIAAAPDDLDILRQALSNRGALYFYSDAAARRAYWTEAFDVAVAARDLQGAAHAGLDLASLDILENDFESGLARVARARAIAEEHGYDNLLMRGLLMNGAIKLIEGSMESCVRMLRSAESLAALHSIDRRMWKARGNMATAFEVMRKPDLSYIEDRRALSRLPDVPGIVTGPNRLTTERRVTIALGNVALRARTSELHRRLFDEFDASWKGLAEKLAAAADEIVTGKVAGFPYEHCKLLPVGPRYVAT